MAKSRVITMRFSDSLLTEIDAKASEVGADRSTWVRGVIMEALGQTAPPPKPKIPGKAKEPSAPPPKDESAQETLIPPDGPCAHENKKEYGYMTVCTDCGSRL